jgi:integrase
MNNLVKYKLRFNRNNKKLKKDEKARVSIEVYFNRNCRKFIPTDVRIVKEQWDEKEKIVNSKNDNHKFLNNYLSEKIKALKQYELELSVKGQTFSPEFLETYLEFAGNGGKFSFNEFFAKKKDEERGASLGTHRGYRRAIKKLGQFNKNIRFSDINYQLIKDFDNFMIDQGLKTNSRANIHNVIKKFMNIAISQELLTIKDMPYNTQAGGGIGKFTIPSEEGTKIPLNFEERERFEKLEYPHSERYEKWKDAFLFTCYTGLRNCDAQAFSFSHLVHTSKGYSIDLHKMIKTKRPVYLELFTLFDGKPEKILRKYLIKKYGTDDYEAIVQTGDTASPIFPSIHTADFNVALKVMASDAKIQKKLSTHCGRHTFGTQMAILTGGNQYLVMDLMGHSDPTTTLIYVKLGERMVNKQLRNVNWTAYDPKPIANELGRPVKGPLGPGAVPQGKKGIQEKVPGKDMAGEIISYLYSDIIPNIDFKTGENIPFAIDKGSLEEYVSLLPFSPKDLTKYQKAPFALNAFIVGMKYSKYVEAVEGAMNKEKWFQESCLKVQVKFLPVPLKGLDIIEI